MIKIRVLEKEDISLLEEFSSDSFLLFGTLLPSYQMGKWDYEIHYGKEEQFQTMSFPKEKYKGEEGIFLGAFLKEELVGFSLLKRGDFAYMFLDNLAVKKAYRRKGIGKALLKSSEEISRREGYQGIYTIAQDNNLGACLFYLKNGFLLKGLDTNIYRHTSQEGKTDLFFYRENKK